MIHENDSRLLAYVLGELTDLEESEIRRAVQAQPELCQAVEDYRKLADVLTGIYASEPLPEPAVGARGRDFVAPGFNAAFRSDRQDASAEWRWTRFALQATLVLFFCGGLYAILNPVQTETGDSQPVPALVSFVSSEDIAQLDEAANLGPTVSFSTRPEAGIAAVSGTETDWGSVADSESHIPHLPKRDQTKNLSDFGYTPEELAKNNPPTDPAISEPDFSSDFAHAPAAKPERYPIPGLDRSLSYAFRDTHVGHKSLVRSTTAISRSNIIEPAASTRIAKRSDELQKPSATAVWQEAPFVSPLEKPVAVFGPEDAAESYFLTRSFLLDINLLPPESLIDVSQIVNYLENHRFEMRQRALCTSSDASDVRVWVELGTHPWLPGLWLAKIVFEQDSGLDPNQRFQITFNPAQIGAYRRIGSGTLISTADSPVCETAPVDQTDLLCTAGNQKPAPRRFVALYELVPHAALDNPAGIPGPSGYAQASRPLQGSRLSASQSYSGPELVCSQQRPAFSGGLANYCSDVGAMPIQLFQIEIGSPVRLSDKSAILSPFNAAQKLRCYLPKPERLEETSRQSDFRMTAAVALWAQLLAGSPYIGAATIDSVEALLDEVCSSSTGQDEFHEMVRKTRELYQNDKRMTK